MKSLLCLLPSGVYKVILKVEASPLGGRLARGAFWSLTGSLIARGLGLFASIFVGRLLGKSAFGELSVVQNTVAVFGTVAGFGMGLTANKYVAEFKRTNPTRAGEILAFASVTSWVSSGLMAITLFFCAPWLASNTLAAPQIAPLIRIGAVLLFLLGVNGAQTGALAGFEAFKSIARVNLICGVLTFPLMVIGAQGWGVAGALWGLTVAQLGNCILCAIAVRKEAELFSIVPAYGRFKAQWALFSRFSLPAILTGLLNSATTWIAGALVVNQVSGFAEMGIYNAALRVKILPESFVAMLIAPMLPILSEAFGKGDRSTFERTLFYNFLLATAIIVPISLIQIAAPFLTLLPFGDDYTGYPSVVQWLMSHAIIYALIFPMGSVLISMGRMWISWFVNLAFAVLFLVGSLVLIPKYGVSGLAAAQTIAFCIANIPCVLFLYRELPEVMRFLRWGLVFISSLMILAACLSLPSHATPRISLITGSAAACSFVFISCRILLKAKARSA